MAAAWSSSCGLHRCPKIRATCHDKGVAVTVLEALDLPMVRALGLEMASAWARSITTMASTS